MRGVCGACAGCVRGVCRVCAGCVQGVCGACGGGAVVERKYRSPLYYPDTLVNLDTCLGVLANNIVKTKSTVLAEKFKSLYHAL